MDGTAIVAALDKLHIAFPKRELELWIGYRADGREKFTAYVQYDDNPLVSVGDNPSEVADNVIAQRPSADEARQRRIAKLRAELAVMEAK